MKVIIVGGVAGGASAAARIRRLDEQAEIIIIERSNYISYANCGLPYYVGNIIESQEDLILQTPDRFWNRFHIDVRVNQEVIDINPFNKTVLIKKLESGKIYEEMYDKLILSPGAKPIKPNLMGIENEKIFTLRTVEDTLKMKQFITTDKPHSVTIIGGGFIGIEMAENLSELGLDVTMVEYSNQLLSPLDFDMSCIVYEQMNRHGIHLMLDTLVTQFEKSKEKIMIKTSKGNILSDFVLLAVGVTPDTYLAKKAGIELGIKESIIVNEKMETSIPDIYAVGDAIEVKHFITQDKTLISLAGPANRQGRIVADNICGGNSTYHGSQGSSILKLFDMTIASTGINEKMAKELNIDYERVVLSPSSHASYYPNGKVMTMKILYGRESLQILGAQIIGYDGVDKRIDVIATAIRANLKATDLKELELSYAPPYSSAKDPVNMAGFIIENIVNKKVKQFHYEELDSLLNNKNVTLLDTRTIQEYQRGHISNFINIPLDELREHLNEIDKSKPVYVICQSGLRSYLACRILIQNGYDCYNFSGGYRFYDIVIRKRQQANENYACGIDKSIVKNKKVSL